MHFCWPSFSILGFMSYVILGESGSPIRENQVLGGSPTRSVRRVWQVSLPFCIKSIKGWVKILSCLTWCFSYFLDALPRPSYRSSYRSPICMQMVIFSGLIWASYLIWKPLHATGKYKKGLETTPFFEFIWCFIFLTISHLFLYIL